MKAYYSRYLAEHAGGRGHRCLGNKQTSCTVIDFANLHQLRACQLQTSSCAKSFWP